MSRSSVRSTYLIAAAVVLVILIVFAARCRSGSEEGSTWASHPLWQDGRAEINAYQAIAMRYGQPRSYTDYQIVVREPFSRRLLVKADPDHDPDDVLPVIKMNRILNYQTGVYAYHQMLSYFFDIEDMQPLKWTLAHFEWCGNTFKQFTRRKRQAKLETHTYWDVDADQVYDLQFDDQTVFYDQLPVWLRSQPLEPGSSRRLQIYPTALFSKGPRPESVEAALTIPGYEEIDLADGTRRRAVLVQVGLPDGLHRFWFDPEFPHVLLGWEQPDGERGRLQWSRRMRYWELNQPGDERLLEPGAEGRGSEGSAQAAPEAPGPAEGSGSVEGDESGVEDAAGVEAPLPLDKARPDVPEVGKPAGPVELDQP